MDISPIAFYIFSTLAIAFSGLVVLKKTPVASAFSLVMVFFCFAGIYATMSAHLVAALQVLVYAGAIMVLFVFVIMLLNADVPSLDLMRNNRAIQGFAALLVFGLMGLFIWAFRNQPVLDVPRDMGVERVEALGGNTRVMSTLLFSEYILPFELTSVLLLAGIVAAVAIAKI